MREPKEPLGARVVEAIGALFFDVVGQIVLTAILAGYFLLCVWLFDRFGVSTPDAQLAWVLAPIVVGGLAIAAYFIRNNRGK